MMSKEHGVQNKGEIQGGRSCFLPGRAPVAIWRRGLLFRPLDRGLFVFLEFAADYFHQFPATNCTAPLAASLCSQRVLSAIPLQGTGSIALILSRPSPLEA